MMIDSVNSQAEALTALAGTGVSGERDTGDPAFMQVLEQVLGGVTTPAATGVATGATLQEAISAASQLALQTRSLGERIFSTQADVTPGIEGAGTMSQEGQDSAGIAVETLLALLSAAGLQIQPLHIQTQEAGRMVIEVDGSSPDAVACIPNIAGTTTVSPHERLALLKQALAGQGVLTGLRSNGLLTQNRMEDQQAPNAGPAADMTTSAITGAQPDTSETASILIQQTVSGKDADTIHNGKAASPDAQPLEKLIADHDAALRTTVTTDRPAVGPESRQATPIPSMAAARTTDGSARTGPDGSSRADETHSGPASTTGNGLRIMASSSSEGQPASHNGMPRHETDWAAGPGLEPVNNQPATAGRAVPDAAAQAGPNSALLGSSVVEQVAQRAHLLLRNGRAGVNIQLEPEDLGKVRVFVGLGSEGLHVKLAAESSDTRGILQASLPQLRQALESQGLRVDRFDLAHGSGASSFGPPQDDSQQHPRLSGGTAQWQHAWEDGSTPESAGSPGALAPSSLVDYRI